MLRFFLGSLGIYWPDKLRVSVEPVLLRVVFWLGISDNESVMVQTVDSTIPKKGTRAYHIGLCKPFAGGLYARASKNDTLILEARTNIDYLSPQTWKYLGCFQTTKTALRSKQATILEWVNTQFGTAYVRGEGV